MVEDMGVTGAEPLYGKSVSNVMDGIDLKG